MRDKMYRSLDVGDRVLVERKGKRGWGDVVSLEGDKVHVEWTDYPLEDDGPFEFDEVLRVPLVVMHLPGLYCPGSEHFGKPLCVYD